MPRFISILIVTLMLTTGLMSFSLNGITSSTAQEPPTDDNCRYDLAGKTIRFYHFGDLSGIYTFITLPVLAGFEDAIDYYNANGGVCGATFAMEYRDTAFQSENSQAAWDTFSNREDVNVIFLYNTEDSELLRDQAAEAQIPLMVGTASVQGLYGEDADDPGYVFSITPLYPDQYGAFCRYVSENWESFGIEGDPVIGHVSWGGAFGQSSETPESRAYCESLGIQTAAVNYYLPILPDITPMVQAVIDSGANIIYTTSLADGPARLATVIDSLGLKGQVLLGGPNWVLDASSIQLAGEAMEGMVGQLPYIWWDEYQHPGIQFITQRWVEYRVSDDPETALELRNIAYLIAWAAVDLYREVIIETVNRVGYENLDGQAVYETLISGQTFSALDGVLSFSYDETHRAPRQTRLGTITFIEQADSIMPLVVPVTDWIDTPDLIPGGADVP